MFCCFPENILKQTDPLQLCASLLGTVTCTHLCAIFFNLRIKSECKKGSLKLRQKVCTC